MRGAFAHSLIDGFNQGCLVSSNQVGSQVLVRVLVTGENVEGVSVDLNITTNWHVGWVDESSTLVNILVLSAL